jgi:hypothetical protein
VNIATQDFEGAFPGAWAVVDTAATPGHQYLWGKRDCRAFSGSFSGWGVGGGVNGASLPCTSQYPDLVDSWLSYGPFSLADTAQADLGFKLWLNSEPGFDFVCRLASLDGSNYYGTCTSGSTAGWSDRYLDLARVPELGNLTGKSAVWAAVLFTSDRDGRLAEGGYVDNIVLRKCAGGSCPPAVSGGLTEAIGSQLKEWPVHLIKPQ